MFNSCLSVNSTQNWPMLSGRGRHLCSKRSVRCLSHLKDSTHAGAAISLDLPAIAMSAAAAAVMAFSSPAFATVPLTTEPGTNLGFMSNEEVDAKRAEYHIKRAYDGHVSLQNKQTKEFWDLKLDMKYPGMLLFRAPESGQVYVLAYANLQQVDLSDDDMLAAISIGEWEKDVERLEAPAEEGGEVQKLEVTREGFFNMLSIVEP